MTAPDATVLGAIYAAAAMAAAALIKALFDKLVADKATKIAEKTLSVTAGKTAADIAHSLNEDLDRDRKESRANIEKLEEKIDALKARIEALSSLVENEKLARERAEAEAAQHRENLFASRKEAEEWKKKYEGEKAAAELFARLYDTAKNGGQPDMAIIESLEQSLRESGYLPNVRPLSPAPAAPESKPPSLPLPPEL